MPVRKYWSIEEMKASRSDPDPTLLTRRIRFAWRLAAAFTSPRPRGIRKYRSLEEATNGRS